MARHKEGFPMRAILITLFLVVSVRGFSQDSLRRYTMGTFHISSQAYVDTTTTLTALETVNLNTDSTLMVLSLVDRDGSISKNWNKFTARYTNGNYLIVVDRG